ncbi:MAG TPA: glycosyltransferase [Longimicrobiales bacterium]|nr:glycosyltransferase [Longimicrobiales bacterium]
MRRPGRSSPERMRVLDIDLARPLHDLAGLDGYDAGRALIRLHETPIGVVDVAIHDGTCTVAEIRRAVREGIGDRLPDIDAGAAASPGADTPDAAEAAPLPTMTVAVCTRDRPDDLAGCLDALLRLDYPDLEILVVDNAPRDDGTAAVCAARPRVRRLLELRPGLNWARNRALLEASGEILAFTDDDARVEPSWARRLAEAFQADPQVMAVAGLVIPLELETPAQIMFEEYGGLSGGFTPITIRPGPDWGVRGMWHYALLAPHGSGANMAFRRVVFETTGRFDPALDVGTPTNGGGDTEMLFRVMAHGYAMAYEPRAIVRHRHRRDYEGLRRQVAGWGSGGYAFLLRSMTSFPRASWVLALVGLRGIAQQGARLLRPGRVPRALVLSEVRGIAAAPWRYLQARAAARDIARRCGEQVRERGS